MHVTFPRLPDYDRAYALVERDDGTVYQLYGSDMAGPRLPHDIRHLVVERELGIADGIWGAIAAGAVFTSMRHVSGRRPPHAAERSSELLAGFRDRGLRAEALANLVECVALLDHPSGPQIRQLAATRLSVLPEAHVDTGAIAAAATALQVEAARWARLRVGQEISYDWPRAALAARRFRPRQPRTVRPKKDWNRRGPATRLRWPDGRAPGRADRARPAHPAALPRGRPGRRVPGGHLLC
jgi:hypothetical protein